MIAAINPAREKQAMAGHPAGAAERQQLPHAPDLPPLARFDGAERIAELEAGIRRALERLQRFPKIHVFKQLNDLLPPDKRLAMPKRARSCGAF